MTATRRCLEPQIGQDSCVASRYRPPFEDLLDFSLGALAILGDNRAYLGVTIPQAQALVGKTVFVQAATVRDDPDRGADRAHSC